MLQTIAIGAITINDEERIKVKTKRDKGRELASPTVLFLRPFATFGSLVNFSKPLKKYMTVKRNDETCSSIFEIYNYFFRNARFHSPGCRVVFFTKNSVTYSVCLLGGSLVGGNIRLQILEKIPRRPNFGSVVTEANPPVQYSRRRHA